MSFTPAWKPTNEPMTITARRNTDGKVVSVLERNWYADDNRTLIYYYSMGNGYTSCNRHFWFEEEDCACCEDEDETPDCRDDTFTILSIKNADGEVLYSEDGPDLLYYKLRWHNA